MLNFLFDYHLSLNYYLGLNLNSSVNLKAEVLSPKQVELLWNNKDTSEYNYKVERSSDRYKWITIGICPEKTSSYIDNDINSFIEDKIPTSMLKNYFPTQTSSALADFRRENL